jgi:hypothetical protein
LLDEEAPKRAPRDAGRFHEVNIGTNPPEIKRQIAQASAIGRPTTSAARRSGSRSR